MIACPSMALEAHERLIGEAVAAARAAWPAIELPSEAFAAHIAQLGLGARVMARRGPEIYLALACARGDVAALQAFDTELLPGARRQLGRMGVGGAWEDELVQSLRVRLLVGDPPRIAKYRGDGSLEAWVRVVATHLALNEIESRKVHVRQTLAAQAEQLVRRSDPELSIARDALRQPLAEALETALLALSPREKTLLRLHILDNLTIDEIGTMYRVHRATAARWLVSIRGVLLASVRKHLQLPARPTSSEFRSIVALLREELSVNVERALAAREAPGSEGIPA
jgi:RNA polymerase sigma-70 factor (ECF subfamily)